MSKYTKFIEGESIDLCVPSRAAINEGWADWFNDQRITTYLEQGRFPNLRENQERFYDSLVERERLALLILPKDGDYPVGTISLSDINFEKRSCQVAMLIGNPTKESKGNLFALEAMARIAEHAFLELGIDRIWAGQSYPSLTKWNKHLELIGYKSEGILRNAFVKGRLVTDMVMISCQFDDYQKIKKMRVGHYWPGKAIMAELISSMPEKGFADLLCEVIERESQKYFSELKFM